MSTDQRIPTTIYYAGGQQAHVHAEGAGWIATCDVRDRDEENDDFTEPEPTDDAIRFQVGQCLALDQLPHVEVTRVPPADWSSLGEPSPSGA
jgi:hypothetical protein